MNNLQSAVDVDPDVPVGYETRIHSRLARTPQEIEDVYRLRYAAYRREGTIDPIADGRFTDDYDGDPNALVISIFAGDELAGTIRFHIISAESPFGPALDTYGDVLMPFVEAGDVIIDSSRFVTNPMVRSQVRNLHFEVLRLAGLAADHFDGQWLLATVRQEHTPFYKRYFGLQPFSEPRAYPGLNKKLILMGEFYPGIRDSIRAKYPVFRTDAGERFALFGPAHLPLADERNDNQRPEGDRRLAEERARSEP